MGQGFDRSFLEVVSVNFFCLMKEQKKALLGLWQFAGNLVGHPRWQTAVQMQGLWHFVHPECTTAKLQKPVSLV
jgi:hypothetical protein